MKSNEVTAPTQTIESDHPDVVSFTRSHIGNSAEDVDQAVKLYYAVRDCIRYDPYRVDLTTAGMKASTTLRARRGWCVSKAVLLAACCRSVGIPARLGFADVRNHLSTARLRENLELCRKFRLLPLEFAGRNDSLYHPFDEAGNRHMEYIRYRGVYTDLPIDEIARTFREQYPFLQPQSDLARDSFDEDVDRETVDS